MTSTEQDKELREKLDELLKSPRYGVSLFAGHRDILVEILDDFITADRKRVALEARLQEVEVSIIELERSDDPRFYSKDEAIRSQRARYTHLEAELKAQQEEV